ncbi:hypothetical protein M3Y96_00398200 [Aphelenchoides besseyi]|nr:hypothetical protein M3Y96_00398200 [Aphelenchoides besseyi]
MVTTLDDDPSKYNVYRVNVNQPDKLSDLVWLRLKRIFDARPSVYKFILSLSPTNFKQECPFPQSGTCRITEEPIETEQQIRERFAVLSEKTTISFELKKDPN